MSECVPTGLGRLDQAVRSLQLGLRRLEPNQGRIARRNARRAVLGAIRQLRNALGEDFPRLEKKAPSTEEPQYLVEVFYAQRRIGRRLYTNRWERLSSGQFGGILPNALFMQCKIRPLTYTRSVRVLRQLRARTTGRTYRLRQAGNDNIILGDLL